MVECMEEHDAIVEALRRLRLRLASEGAQHQIAHEIIIVEVLAKRLGVYEDIADEIDELKRLYVALYYSGELLSAGVSYERRFKRLRRARRVAAPWT